MNGPNIAHIIRSFDVTWQGAGTSSNFVSEQFRLPVNRDAQCYLLRMSVKAVWYVGALDPTPTPAIIQFSLSGGASGKVGIDIDPFEVVALAGTLSVQQLAADNYADWVGRLPMHNAPAGTYAVLISIGIPVGAAAFDPIQVSYCLEIENS